MQNSIKISSYILMTSFLIMAFMFHLMPTVLAATVVFLLISKVFGFFEPKVKSKLAHQITLLIVALVIACIIAGLTALGYYAFKASSGGFYKMSEDIFNILQQLKNYLPPSLVQYIPQDVFTLNQKVAEIIKQNTPHIFEVTTHSAKVFVHVVLGIFIGAVTAFSFIGFNKDTHPLKPLSAALFARISNFGSVFERVIFAQGKISAINATLTGIYLLIALPIFGIDMPYAKSLVILTFLVGLIPVLGNLISNVVIVLISLTVSFEVAVASLAFLVIVHKLEYYINAKIVGQQIKTEIWELLIAMVIMETLFGLIGVAVAPIIYGYIKEELKQLSLI